MVEVKLRHILYIPIFEYLFGFGSNRTDEHFLLLKGPSSALPLIQLNDIISVITITLADLGPLNN